MSAKTGESILRNHSLPIVGDANPFPPALLYVHSDLPCARVQRVLHKFLYDRRRALDDLAGCDAVGDVVGKDSNFHKGNLATKGTKGTEAFVANSSLSEYRFHAAAGLKPERAIHSSNRPRARSSEKQSRRESKIGPSGS